MSSPAVTKKTDLPMELPGFPEVAKNTRALTAWECCRTSNMVMAATSRVGMWARGQPAASPGGRSLKSLVTDDAAPAAPPV
jgi:hypothetical protein